MARPALTCLSRARALASARRLAPRAFFVVAPERWRRRCEICGWSCATRTRNTTRQRMTSRPCKVWGELLRRLDDERYIVKLQGQQRPALCGRLPQQGEAWGRLTRLYHRPRAGLADAREPASLRVPPCPSLCQAARSKTRWRRAVRRAERRLGGTRRPVRECEIWGRPPTAVRVAQCRRLQSLVLFVTGQKSRRAPGLRKSRSM